VVQQGFITGWGNFIKWAPFLPELPEHRRLGYRPPRDLDSVVVVSGDGQPVLAPGPMGWLQRKMDEAQKQAMERSGGATASSGATAAAGKADPIEVDAAPDAKASGNSASRARSRNGKRKGGGKGTASTASTGATVRAQGRDNGAAASVPAGAVIVPRKAKPASAEDRSE
jgi:hypothetical protein